MLTIRGAQMTVFEDSLLGHFTDRMAAHIAAEFPISYGQMGPDGTRRFVHEGIRRAGQHGLLAPGAVALFLELLLDFGLDFERSPDRTWAFNLLSHPTLPDVLKARAIHERMTSRTGRRRIVVADGVRPV